MEGWVSCRELLSDATSALLSPPDRASASGASADSTGQVPAALRLVNSMGHIGAYVAATAALGVPAQDLFEPSDLHGGGDLRAVVRNLHSLARVAQAVEGFDGPRLGPPPRLDAREE